MVENTNNTINPDYLYTVNDLANLGFGKRTKIYKLIKNGSLNPTKVGHSTKFLGSELLAFIRKNTGGLDG